MSVFEHIIVQARKSGTQPGDVSTLLKEKIDRRKLERMDEADLEKVVAEGRLEAQEMRTKAETLKTEEAKAKHERDEILGRGRTYLVNPGAETDEEVLQEHKPGTPIIVRQGGGGGGGLQVSLDLTSILQDALERRSAPPEKPGKSYLFNPDGKTNEEMLKPLDSDQPVVIVSKPAPASPQVSGLGQVKEILDTIKEMDGLKGVIRGFLGISESPPRNDSHPSVVLSTKDKDGNPVTMDVGSYIELMKFEGRETRANKMNEEIRGFMTMVRETGPRAVNAVDRLIKMRGGEAAPSTPPLVEVACEKCGERVKVPYGTEQFDCKKCDQVNQLTWKGNQEA